MKKRFADSNNISFVPIGPRKADDIKEFGFTVIELLAVIACIAIMAVTLLPALAATRPDTQAIVCLSNQRQLMVAWTMYARDNNDGLVVNHAANGVNDTNLSWVTGWEGYSGSEGDTNTAWLINPQYALLGSYLKSPAVFRCPADRSCAYGLSGPPRVRSYSMNIAVGPDDNPGEDPHAKFGDAGYDSWLPWPTYKVFIKESEIHHPSHIWVILDEHPDSINDGCFAVRMPATGTGSAVWIDTPANLHGNGCDFAFADGHSEIHKWANAPSEYDIPYVIYQSLPQDRYIPGPLAQDIRWVAEHTTERNDGKSLPY